MKGLVRFVPNVITTFRVLGVPVLLWLLQRAESEVVAGMSGDVWRWRALGMLLAIGVSDVLDGYIARRFELTSRFGALFDAAADKLVQLATLAFLAFGAEAAFVALPLWFFTLVVARDAVLSVGWFVLHRLHERPPVEHQIHGKFSTVAMFLLLIWMIADFPAVGVSVGTALIAVVIVGSTSAYVVAGWQAHQATAGLP
jgi:CDP-diacylglycerol--glycerol-3-phosphate 3-phosphatidyltransferase